jgi:hypothetical protein
VAIVKAIRYNLEVFDTIELWEFIDVVDKVCVLLILKCDLWGSILLLLQVNLFIWMILICCFLIK